MSEKTKSTPNSKPAKTTRAEARARRKKTETTVEEKPLTAKEIEYYRDRLLELRRDLLGDMGRMSTDALDGSGELSNMPVHMADIGTDNYEQEFTLSLIDGERKILAEIDYSLSKINKGEYGICEGTGKVIGRERLEAKPYARYCIEYARKLELAKSKAKKTSPAPMMIKDEE